MTCNGPTLDWTGPTKKLWILEQPIKLPLNYWLLIFWGRGSHWTLNWEFTTDFWFGVS